MREGHNNVIYRSDYQAPAFWVDTVELTFDLDPAKTRVLNKMKVRRNADVVPQALRLDGEELNLARVLVNGQGTSFKLENNQLVLENLPEGYEAFDLEIFTTCAPVMASLSPSPVMLLMPLLGEAATTSWPPWRRIATVFEPIRPVPPMTTTFMVYPPLSMTGDP